MIALALAPSAFALDIQVSPTGADTQPGTFDAPVIYRAAHERKAILSGGVSLQRQWLQWPGKIAFALKVQP